MMSLSLLGPSRESWFGFLGSREQERQDTRKRERERRVNRVFLSFHTMRNSLSITLRDLKIAKFKKRGRMLRCGPEFDAYLAAVGAHGEGKVPQSVIAALTACMGEPVNKAKGATVAYHLTKYVRR
jgi:hypothetical protein